MKSAGTALRRLFAATMVAGLALAFAACGSSAGDDAATSAPDADNARQSDEASESSGMDHSGMDHSQMDHSGMDMSSMLTVDGEYSDERFIDLMVPHHLGAVDMAEIALEGNAEHPEIEQLSQDIVSTQNAEVEELRDIKQQEFGTRDVSQDVSQEDMAMMRMMDDPEAFAESDPFDLAYIEGMIPHHESAVEMSEVALENSDNARIRDLAEKIISGQEAEISEMQSWREEWYPNS